MSSVYCVTSEIMGTAVPASTFMVNCFPFILVTTSELNRSTLQTHYSVTIGEFLRSDVFFDFDFESKFKVKVKKKTDDIFNINRSLLFTIPYPHYTTHKKEKTLHILIES